MFIVAGPEKVGYVLYLGGDGDGPGMCCWWNLSLLNSDGLAKVDFLLLLKVDGLGMYVCLLLLTVDGPGMNVCAGGVGRSGDFLTGVGSG